jgi:hypothetical protein
MLTSITGARVARRPHRRRADSAPTTGRAPEEDSFAGQHPELVTELLIGAVRFWEASLQDPSITQDYADHCYDPHERD